MKVVIAPDSFKGTNSSLRVAQLIEKGLRKVFPDANVENIPVADGGEGSVDAVIIATNGIEKELSVEDPLGRPKLAKWGISGDRAVIEMAEASGLPILTDNEMNPELASTFGTGQLIKEALNQGFKKILIGIGGSATNDGGAGMAQALGYKLLDSSGKEISRGAIGLKDLVSIDSSECDIRLHECEIIVACDVTNPLLGEKGATATYSRQKGADEKMMTRLESYLSNLADVSEKSFGKSFRNIPGSGAAGGLGFGLVAFCSAKIESGIDTILDFIDLENKIKDADLVITGEGKIDGQSLYGKVPIGIAKRCKSENKPLLVIVGDICGNLDPAYDVGIDAIMSSVNRAMPLKEALENSSELLVEAAERALRMIKIGMKMGL